ncbi:hypothetical protein B0181_10590 [Moraxella caviae]|uniref:Uncharacterized protein n=2 Tax=Moraxella caviae TaxID=34060 RepID=A0A1S9ZV06_9GAMM|nr:hypothetical protein B0181_10590 [Moraxella caviae]STZ14045.1 Uncharacterised protein [Moraxella caviae]
MASGKGNLYIGQGENYIYLAHYLTTYFDEVIVPLSEYMSDDDFLDSVEYGELIVGFISVRHYNKEIFNLIYRLTLQACDRNADLNRYRQEFIKAFTKDPRYTP